MNYILKQYDTELIYFSMENTDTGLAVIPNRILDPLRSLRPMVCWWTIRAIK